MESKIQVLHPQNGALSNSFSPSRERLCGKFNLSHPETS